MPKSQIANTNTIVATRAQPQHTVEVYQVIVHCRTEAEQRRLFNRLRREGFHCRLTVL
jgi:hypothetical protein